MTPWIVVLVLLAAGIVALAVLTALGEHRRGGRLGVAVLAGLFFPVAWMVWYSRDELRGLRGRPGPTT